MAKGGGSILLEEEMADPGCAITANGGGQQGGREERCGGQTADRQRGADEVQAAIGRVEVLREVVGPKLVEVFGLPGHDSWVTQFVGFSILDARTSELSTG
jgi:hypothetical protein